MDVLEIFASGTYDRDMKILKILACNSKQFRVYGVIKTLQIDGDNGRTTKCNNLSDNFHLK